MNRGAVIALGVIVAATAGAVPAGAQSGSTRSQAMFGGAKADDARKSLIFDLTAGEGYDDNLEAAGEPRPPIAGFFTAINPSLTYESRGRVGFALSGGSSIRYYNDVGDARPLNYSAGLGLSTPLSRRTSISVNQSFLYSPAYVYGLYAPLGNSEFGPGVLPAVEYAQTPNDVRSLASSTSVDLTQGLTRHSSMEVYTNYRSTTYMGQDTIGFSDVHAIEAGARYGYTLSRDLKIGFDYTFRQTSYRNAQQPIEQNLDGGVEYNLNRAIRLKRTTLSFHVGPTAAHGLIGERVGRYLLAADAVLGRRLGRTWMARAGYHRGFSYVDGLPQPVFGDATTADIGGFLNRRTDLFASVAYSGGDAGFADNPSPFNTYTGDVRIRYALTRRLASYGEYFYYHYNFDPGLPLPPGIDSRQTRNGVRVGIELWVPLYMRHR